VPAILTPPGILQPSQARRPRGMVRINGSPATLLSFEVTNKAHFGADTWKVSLEPWQQPEGFGLEYWADQAPIGSQGEVLIGFLDPTADTSAQPSEWQSLILGVVDDMTADPLGASGGGHGHVGAATLEISGRDLTALLIDTKTSNKWPDHVSSQIVGDLAGQVGLTPQVTATSTPAGQYYAGSYAALGRSIPMWDLIVGLAKNEGFDAYVTGSTLYFGPPLADNDPSPLQLQVTRTNLGQVIGNAESLKLHRSLTLAKDISVKVLSHNTLTGKSIQATSTRAGTGKKHGKSTTQDYIIRRPNLSQAQAQQLADRTLGDVTFFERTLDATLEGDATLDVNSRKVNVSGTGTSFDQSYYLNTIMRKYSWQTGFSMDISAKNHQEIDGDYA
jgi:phage protein D